MKVPLANLSLQQAGVADEVMAALAPIIRDGSFILGKPVQSFEAAFANFVGASHAVGVASGTDALMLSLRALGIGPGEGVVTTPLSFIASAEAIAAVGAVPLFADIDEETMCLSPRAVAARYDGFDSAAPGTFRERRDHVRVRAILPVHLFGQPAAMAPLRSVARECGAFLVEDAAQAVLTVSGGRMAGALGDVAAFSFFPTKNLGGFGDGGAVVTSNAGVAARVRKLRQHGMRTLYEHDELGMNSRLDAIHAAVLEVKLRHVETWTKKREANAARYREGLAGVGDLMLPGVPPLGDRHAYHQFVVRTGRRDALLSWLHDREIEARVYYPMPLHLQPCFKHLGGTAGQYPVAERAVATVLALPVNAELLSCQLDFVIESVRAFFES